jgi:hypothetical protein
VLFENIQRALQSAFFNKSSPKAIKLIAHTRLSESISLLSATSPIDFEIRTVAICIVKKEKIIIGINQSTFFGFYFL